jgi:hypothetical protein
LSLPTGELIAFTGALARVAGEDVGTTYAINLGTLANANYAITFNGDDFAITQLAVTVTVDPDQSKTYGDVDPVFTYTSAPAVGFELANGELIAFTGALALVQLVKMLEQLMPLTRVRLPTPTMRSPSMAMTLQSHRLPSRSR